MCDEYMKLIDAPTEEELVRARAQLKASLMMALESCFAQSEELARQLLIFNRRIPPEEIIAKIDAVDQEAIRRVGRRLLVGANPTLAAIGPLARLPSLDSVRARLVLSLSGFAQRPRQVARDQADREHHEARGREHALQAEEA